MSVNAMKNRHIDHGGCLYGVRIIGQELSLDEGGMCMQMHIRVRDKQCHQGQVAVIYFAANSLNAITSAW